MTMRTIIYATLLACAFLLPVHAARADDFLCPEDLSTKQTAVDTPMGWKANSNITAKMGLSGISLYDDSPESGREPLAPVKRTMQGGSYATWTFDPARKHPVWMACEYHDTAVTLMRAMPDNIRQCRTKDTGAYDHDKVLDCQ